MDVMQNVNEQVPIIVISSLIILNKNDESDDSSESSDSENENKDISLSDMQTLFSILMASTWRKNCS